MSMIFVRNSVSSVMALAQLTPHILTALSLFSGIYLHWALRTRFWLPTLISGIATAIFGLALIFLLQRNYFNFDVYPTGVGDTLRAVAAVAGLGFIYGSLIAALVGYVIKVAPSFFD